MKDVEFQCLKCGQMIVCDASAAGQTTACPGCQAPVTVPAPPPPPPPPPPRPAAKAVGKPSAPPPPPGKTPAAPAKAPPATPPIKPGPVVQTCKLATASLVLAIAGFVAVLPGPLGWIPAIICGHLARSRMRQDTTLMGHGLARAGLIIGYGGMAILLAAGITFLLFFANAVKEAGDSALAKQNSTNQTVRKAEAAPVKPVMDAPNPPATAQDKETAATPAPAAIEKTETTAENPAKGNRDAVKEAVRGALKAFNNDEMEAFKEHLTAKARNVVDPTKLGGLIKGDSFKFGGISISADTAKVTVILRNDEAEGGVNLGLRQEEGQWKLQSVGLRGAGGMEMIQLNLEQPLAAQMGMNPGRTASTGKNAKSGKAVRTPTPARQPTRVVETTEPPKPVPPPEPPKALDLGGNKRAASFDFLEVAGAAPNQKIKAKITNHANKAIRKVQVQLFFLDAGASVLKTSSALLLKADPPIVPANGTAEVEFAVPNVPVDTVKVLIELNSAQFGDGTQWLGRER